MPDTGLADPESSLLGLRQQFGGYERSIGLELQALDSFSPKQLESAIEVLRPYAKKNTDKGSPGPRIERSVPGIRSAYAIPDYDFVAGQGIKQDRNFSRIELSVPVRERYKVQLCRLYPGSERHTVAPVLRMRDAPHPGIAGGNLLRQLPRAVGAAVVYKNDLEFASDGLQRGYCAGRRGDDVQLLVK